MDHFRQNWQKASLGKEGLSFFEWKGHTFFTLEDNNKIILLNLLLLNYWTSFIIFRSNELISQVSDVAHGPLVFAIKYYILDIRNSIFLMNITSVGT